MNTDVVLEKVENRIHLYSQFFPGVQVMCKAVPGGNWAGNEDKGGKYWTYPLALMTMDKMRHVFTDMLIFGDDLVAWEKAERDMAAELGDLGRTYDAELHVVPSLAPRIDAAMQTRSYQRVGARFIGMGKRVCLFDEPSLGKTIQYLGGLMEAGVWEGEHLVLAPKTALQVVWYNQIMRWTDGASVFVMPDGRDKRANVLAEFLACPSPTKFLCVNPEMLQTRIGHWCKTCGLWREELARTRAAEGGDWPDQHHFDDHKLATKIYKQDWPGLFAQEWTSIIVDESDRWMIGIRGSQTGKRTQVGEGLMRLRTKEGGVRVASTGTPVRGRVKNFWGTFHWVRPEAYTNLWGWINHWLVTSDNGFGITVADVKPELDIEFYRELDSIMLRRTKIEVQPELPQKSYEDLRVQMSASQKKQYIAMQDMGEAELEGGNITGTGVLAEITRLRQFSFGTWKLNQTGTDMHGNGIFKMSPTADSPKLELLLEMLRERGVTGDKSTEFGDMKFAIVSQFTQIIDFIAEYLEKERGIPTLRITGAVSTVNRARAQDNFNTPGGPRVILLNTKAGGSAIDLDAMCDEMFILDETHVPDDQEQVEGRINNRAGRIAPRVFHYMRTTDSIEEAIADDVNDKDFLVKNLLDGRRGVTFALRLLRRAIPE